MGKKKRTNRKNPTPSKKKKASVAVSPSPKKEPTVDQVQRIDKFQDEIASMTEKYGEPEISEDIEKVGLTLEESLARVKLLLFKTRGHHDRAQQNKREADVQIKEEKKNTEAEILVEKKKIDDLNSGLNIRIEKIKSREITLKQREITCEEKEVELTEKEAQLSADKAEAERGFLAEKIRILRPTRDEVERLGNECDFLNEKIVDLHEQAEAKIREEAGTRAKKWAKEDKIRTEEWEEENKVHIEKEAENLRQFDENITKVRREKVDELRTQLRIEREETERRQQDAFNQRIALLDEKEANLDERELALIQNQRAHRAATLDLQAGQMILTEDQEGLSRRVERMVNGRNEDLSHETETLRTQLSDARTTRDAYFKELESREEFDRRFGDRTPEEVLFSLSTAEQKCDELAQQLRERPDIRAAERLHELERARLDWQEERAVIRGELATTQAELSRHRLSAIELETLRKEKEVLEVHKKILDGAVDELRTQVNELTRKEDHRNPMVALTSFDEDEDLQVNARTTMPLSRRIPTLREFAEDLRHRIANGVKGRTLYYTARDIRSFLGGLAMSHLMLLQGISGTGKTSLPLAFSEAVGGGIEIVEVQAGWRDRQDLVGYYNAFNGHYYSTNFLQALYKAGTPAYRDCLFMMVLDEINLSRPEQFFADFLSALEQPEDNRRLTLVNDSVSNAPMLMVDGRHLPIPPNIWFVGTANHDESTVEFADKTYDRAHIMEMPRKTLDAHFEVETRGPRDSISYDNLELAFDNAARAQDQAVKKATEWLRSAPFVDELQKKFRVGWGNRLENQLARYLPVVVESGGSVGEAMDHLLVTKVLRKLKNRHDVRATALEDLKSKLRSAWDDLDKDNPPERCMALIDNEIASKQGEDWA